MTPASDPYAAQRAAMQDLENAIADCATTGLSDREIRSRVRRTLSGRRGFHPFNACWRSSVASDLDRLWQGFRCWRIWGLPFDAIFRMRKKINRA